MSIEKPASVKFKSLGSKEPLVGCENDVVFYESCPHCKFIETAFKNIDNNYEYWLMIEVFVYLHGGKDYCNWKEEKENKILDKE